MNVDLPEQNSPAHTIAFYNTENLFEYADDNFISEKRFSKKSSRISYKERYEKKISNTGLAISKIAFEDFQKPPTLIGLAEVESDNVLTDLIYSPFLEPYNYGFIRYDSPDARGINVALLYDKDNFQVEKSENVFLDLEDKNGEKDYTRDILKVIGYLEGEKIYVLVNHWPSRHGRSDPEGYKRKLAAEKVVALIETIEKTDLSAKIIIMGDFNDNPKNESMQLLTKSKSLYNPMEKLVSYTRGSVNHNARWMVFDQILMTSNFLDQETGGLKFCKADIFDAQFLTQRYGKFQGHPFRTYEGKQYTGGFSDHFPVFIQLKKND